MKCKQCGSYYPLYKDVDGFCSPECAVAWRQQSDKEAGCIAAVVLFFIKLFAMSFPYILLVVFGLRHIFPGISEWYREGDGGLIWSAVIFSAIYGVLFLLSFKFSGETWADVMRIVLTWVKRVGIILTVVLVIYYLLFQNTDFDIVHFMLGI